MRNSHVTFLAGRSTGQIVLLAVVFRMRPPPLELPPKITDYINEHRGPLPPINDPDEPLQMDSLALVRLVAWLEQELGVRIEDDELIAENFATLRTVAQLITPKL